MKVLGWLALGLLLIVGAGLWWGNPAHEATSKGMKLTSSAWVRGGVIGTKYTCRGAGQNPPLAISAVPAGARTLALVLSDPGAPGGVFYHWLVWNVPANVTMIPSDWTAPAGTGVGKNGFGTVAYGAPCPFSGTHRYHFTLYAVDKSIRIGQGASWPKLMAALRGHILAQAELVGIVSASH